MNVFALRQWLVEEYADYTRSFITVRDARIRGLIESELDRGLLWPEPMVQLNPTFEPGEWVDLGGPLGFNGIAIVRQRSPPPP